MRFPSVAQLISMSAHVLDESFYGSALEELVDDDDMADTWSVLSEFEDDRMRILGHDTRLEDFDGDLEAYNAQLERDMEVLRASGAFRMRWNLIPANAYRRALESFMRDDESGLRRQERYAAALYGGSSDPMADSEEYDTFDPHGGDWEEFLEVPYTVSWPDPDGSVRREIEAEYGKGYEGELKHGGYFYDGVVYNNPPEDTIAKMYDDGSALVYDDEGRTYKMSKEEMEDYDWKTYDKHRQRFPHGYGATSKWGEDRWNPNAMTGQFEMGHESDWDSKRHRTFNPMGYKDEVKKDMDEMWDERDREDMRRRIGIDFLKGTGSKGRKLIMKHMDEKPSIKWNDAKIRGEGAGVLPGVDPDYLE